MNIPKLRVRPTSTQSCAAWGGVYHNPTAPLGTWYDERNLCSDMSPTAVARRQRSRPASIDGNALDVPISSMCGGDHIVLLDQHGKVWCNGNSVDTGIADRLVYFWTLTPEDSEVDVSPDSGRDISNTALGGYVTVADTTRVIIYEEDQGGGEWYMGNVHLTSTYETKTRHGHTIHVWKLTDLELEIESPDTVPGYGYEITLRTWSEMFLTYTGQQMVRMGAYVYLMRDNVFVNAVKLASGATMVQGTDYGTLDANLWGGIDTLTMTLCDIDGNPYTGVVVSASEPAQEGYWLDTSGNEPKLMEWSATSYMWVSITSTFVKCGPFHRAQISNYELPIRAGDTVQMTPGENAGAEAKALLTGAHYIYALIEDVQGVWLVLSGILDDDEVTDGNAQPKATRAVPKMDFVVECGNRLWGCRYDESAAINEIYASKLGDAANWEVYQGLSTDSWRASRGTAAPFTGAAVLDGHPLFFREESLEKVYPSSSGAHQIQTFDIEGVEQYADGSLVVIEDRLYYKSRMGVMVYTGTVPRRISDALGDMVFTGGSAARHGRKYCLSTALQTGNGTEPVVLVYDLDSGDWHIEDEGWNYLAVTWKDDLYYIDEANAICSMKAGAAYGAVSWWAETAPQAIHYYSKGSKSLTEHKWISYIRIRVRLKANGTATPTSLKVYVAYDDDAYELKATLTGPAAIGTREISIFPKRKDSFRLRFEGVGPAQIYDVSYRMERSEGGH